MREKHHRKLKPIQISIILGMGTAVSLLGDSTLYTVLPNPDIRVQLGVSLTMVGILLGINRGIRLLVNGPIGLLYERKPRRPLLILSLLLGAVSNIIYSVGTGFWPLLIGRVSWGIAWSLLFIGCMTMILDVGSEENRGHLSGSYQMIYLLGIGLSSLIGGILTDQFGFRLGQLICSGVVLAMALVWYFFLPETRPAKKDMGQTKKNSVNQILPLKIVIPASSILFLTRFITWGVLSSTTAIWISKLFGGGIEFANVILPIGTITGVYSATKMLPGVASARVAGKLSDFIKKRWMVVALAILIGVIGIWIMSNTTTKLSLFGALLTPIIGGSVESLIPAIIGDQADKKIHGRILGIVNTFGDLGATLGPIAALWALDSSLIPLKGLYRICAGLLVLAMIISYSQTKTENNFRNQNS